MSRRGVDELDIKSSILSLQRNIENAREIFAASPDDPEAYTTLMDVKVIQLVDNSLGSSSINNDDPLYPSTEPLLPLHIVVMGSSKA